jgi:TetR/AcrR family transcriptional regulator, cholesterol catabolism regulator
MTRDDILMAAAQVFNQKGYHAASMQDIANTVHLQKASLYHHVSSKQEILLELLDRALELLIERLQKVVYQPDLPDVKLRNAIRTYLETLAEFRDLAAVLILEHRSLPPELNETHIPRRDRFEKLWRDLIREGKDAGIFNCADPALTSRALLGVLNWTITWYRPDGPLTALEIADQFADLFLKGLMIRDGINRYPNYPSSPDF